MICVDWENGAALPNYVRAAVNTRLVGKQVTSANICKDFYCVAIIICMCLIVVLVDSQIGWR